MDDTEIAQLNHIDILNNLNKVNDIIPIGSRGILAEIYTICQNINCKFTNVSGNYVDLHKSAGPSTCIIFTCTVDIDLSKFTKKPIYLGTLQSI